MLRRTYTLQTIRQCTMSNSLALNLEGGPVVGSWFLKLS
jgi:hypothetical protein